MNLPEYIQAVGDAAAAEKFGVKPRTAASWRRRERFPRPEQAEMIVRTSPVTYAGIYGNEDAPSESPARNRRSKDKKSP